MHQKDLEINRLIMQEIGLDISQDHRVIDQDRGIMLEFNGKTVVAPGAYGGPNTIEFDPFNNKKMMNRFFGYFLEKHAEEEETSVMTYYNIDGEDPEKSAIECKMSDMSKIRSGEYLRDSLKCTDIIMRLNGDPNPDLAKFDTPQERPTVRGGRKNGRNNKSHT